MSRRESGNWNRAGRVSGGDRRFRLFDGKTQLGSPPDDAPFISAPCSIRVHSACEASLKPMPDDYCCCECHRSKP